MYLSDIIEIEQNIEFFGTAVDSRKVEKDNLFAVFTGSSELNQKYADDAVSRGAAVILTDDITLKAKIPVICRLDAIQIFGQINKAIYQPLPKVFAAVTGTNGKTSTAVFLRQIWEYAGLSAASMGTLGIQTSDFTEYTGWTTADNVTMYKELSKVARKGVKYAVIEASSHGLSEGRLAGCKFVTAGFTNITQDHLDYHKTMENYFQAKMKLFETYLTDEAVAVLNADISEFERIKTICKNKGVTVWSYGVNGKDLKILKQDLHQVGQDLELQILGYRHRVSMKITGSFQAWNALCALGMAIASGIDAQTAVAALPFLQNPEGRMELVGTSAKGAGIYVDFAHTPDGIENALKSLRHHADGKLWIAFGCGGNRDATKRPKMGALAQQLADTVIVTDDNPRYEEPEEIRRQILTAAPEAIEIGDRAEAIRYVIEHAEKGDVVLIAGKGHEEGQIIKGKVYPFNDKQEVLKYLPEAS